MTSISNKLREARKLIERGWTRHELERGNRRCIVGAVYSAIPEVVGRRACLDWLQMAVDVKTQADLAEWNDSCPSKKPVLAAFDKAIELAEAAQ